MKTAKEIQENLPYFTGTETYFQYYFGIKFTDGIKYLADNAECYWLINIIVSYQVDPKVKEEGFQVYKLKVNADKSALVEITDGNKNILAKQDIEFTDFPLEEIEIWCIDNIVLLPSEY